MARLVVRALALGAIGTNCYVAHSEGSDRAFVVDPGDEADRVLDLLDEHGLAVDAVLVTHCHWDHIGAVAPVARATGAPVYMSEIEAFVLEQDPNRFVPPGVGPFEPWPVEHKLAGDEHLDIAGIRVRTLALPGHSPGTIGFFVDGERGAGEDWLSPPVLFDGDLIFQGSVGRTDLPGADTETLLDSCRRVFDELPDDTVLLSGHGPPTTIAAERAANPFLRGITADR